MVSGIGENQHLSERPRAIAIVAGFSMGGVA
jgi:hypothetical protein